MPGTVKSELLSDADRSHKCDSQEKVCWIRHLSLDKSHFITGGAEFDDVMFRLLSGKVKVPLNSIDTAILRALAETAKVELSTSTEEVAELFLGGDYIDISITRREFEEASKDLLMRTIEETKKILQEHPNQKPEIILLTGGASQMPMVQREMEEAFPQYRGKIICFRPSRATAYGAARFGTEEMNADVD